MNSNWQYGKSRSSYHFDDTKLDLPGDYFFYHGRIEHTWQVEIDGIASRPMTWENRKNTCGRTNQTPKYIEAEENDLISVGADPKMPLVDINDDFDQIPNLKEVAESFGLEKPNFRLHIQKTGQVFNKHIDTLDQIYPGVEQDKIIRIQIMLTDWEPGQYYTYGTYNYANWKAGDVHSFDWYNVPHCTANASYSPRITLQLTGIKTDKTARRLEAVSKN